MPFRIQPPRLFWSDNEACNVGAVALPAPHIPFIVVVGLSWPALLSLKHSLETKSKGILSLCCHMFYLFWKRIHPPNRRHVLLLPRRDV